MAHGLYRVFEWVSPDLVAEFDATQSFPWDAAFHGWVSAHPDPVAGWDLSATPPLVQQVVGLGEIPDWLAATEPRFEVVLLGGDVGSRPLLEEVERFGGGDGSLKAARLLLANCPVVLRWGFEEAGHAAAAAARLEAVGGRAGGRAMQPGTFRHFIPPGPPTT